MGTLSGAAGQLTRVVYVCRLSPGILFYSKELKNDLERGIQIEVMQL